MGSGFKRFTNARRQAQPTHKARALYDYTRQTDEELSFTEDAQLEVFDISDPDWILVGLDGEYGFAPANYIEVSGVVTANEEEARAASPEPPAPSLPRRPPRAPGGRTSDAARTRLTTCEEPCSRHGRYLKPEEGCCGFAGDGNAAAVHTRRF